MAHIGAGQLPLAHRARWRSLAKAGAHAAHSHTLVPPVGARWHPLVPAGAHWRTLAHAGACWRTLAHAGARWRTLAHAGARTLATATTQLGNMVCVHNTGTTLTGWRCLHTTHMVPLCSMHTL